MTITDHAARILGEGAANALHTANGFVRSGRNALDDGDISDAIAYGQAAEAHITLATTLADSIGGDRAGQYRVSADEIRGRLCAFLADANASINVRVTPGPHLTAAPEPADDGTTGRFRVGGLSGLKSDRINAASRERAADARDAYEADRAVERGDGTTGKFRVTGLSGLNFEALREVGADQLNFSKLAKTFVVFRGTPDSVAVDLQTAMDEIRAKRGGQDPTYRSLIAVRNKVLAGYGSKHVKVEQ